MEALQIFILVVLFAILRSTNVPTSKYIMETLHPFMFGVLGAAMTTGILLAAKKFRLPKFSRMSRKEKIEFIKISTIPRIGGIILSLAIYYLPVKGFAVLISLLPIVTSVFSALVLKERPSKFLWTAAILAVIGSIIFKTGGEISFGIGDALVIIGTILYGLSSIVARKFVKKLGRVELLITGNILYGLFNIILALAVGVFTVPQETPTFWGLLLFNVLAVGIAADFIFAHIIREESAYLATTATTAFVPIGSSILGVIFFNEVWTLQELLGGAVLIISAVISSWKKK